MIERVSGSRSVSRSTPAPSPPTSSGEPREVVTLSGAMAKPQRLSDVGRHDVSAQVAARSGGLGTAGAVIAAVNVALIAAGLIKKTLDR
ncbi:MAG: hypothetical protein ACYCW6_00855 [Candidatus Xenobia bacterium]